MEFKEISRDVINRRFRDKSAIYKDVPDDVSGYHEETGVHQGPEEI